MANSRTHYTVLVPEKIDIFPGTTVDRLFLLPAKDVERAHLQWVLDHSGTKMLAAARLGISRSVLDRKMKDWDLEWKGTVS